jgi:hypothetical protein
MGMDLNKLLLDKGVDPKRVLVLRHRPPEPELNKVLPWLAGERPGLFNAYQQIQGEKLERAMHAMEGTGYIASFIGREAGKALFVGLYSIEGPHPLTHEEYWNIPAHIELNSLGMNGSAYGEDNLLGRWQDYAVYGHGGNRLLRQRDPRNFRFTILQRVSPDMEAADVIRLEGSWKQRLHTHEPYGLNDN